MSHNTNTCMSNNATSLTESSINVVLNKDIANIIDKVIIAVLRGIVVIVNNFVVCTCTCNNNYVNMSQVLGIFVDNTRQERF